MAFAGVIQGFTVGNSIVPSALLALHTVTETYSPGVLNAGVLTAGTLTVTDSTLGTLATLDILGTTPTTYATANFVLAKTVSSVTITEVPSAPPPSFAWKNAVNGDWATAAGADTRRATEHRERRRDDRGLRRLHRHHRGG